MEKKKYESKTLIAEYKYLSSLEDFRFFETAYRLKDGSIIIEYDGAALSLYGLKLSYKKSIGRKGIYSVDNEEYEFWKKLRNNMKDSEFIDWEAERNEEYKKWQEEYYKELSEVHESALESISCNELPY